MMQICWPVRHGRQSRALISMQHSMPQHHSNGNETIPLTTAPFMLPGAETKRRKSVILRKIVIAA